MGMLTWGVAGAGFASVVVGWVSYLLTIPRGAVPKRPLGTFALLAAGAGLALASLLLAGRSGGLTGWSGGALVTLVVMSCGFALFFAVLFSQRHVPAGDLRVSVGEPVLPFELRDSDGMLFRSSKLTDKRVLLKFFRGSW